MRRDQLRVWSCRKLSRYKGEEAGFRVVLRSMGVCPGQKLVGTLSQFVSGAGGRRVGLKACSLLCRFWGRALGEVGSP